MNREIKLNEKFDKGWKEGRKEECEMYICGEKEEDSFHELVWESVKEKNGVTIKEIRK